MRKSLLIFLTFINGIVAAQIQQVTIGRVELMPNSPTPYLMRDWQNVALGYDSLVFDITKTGEYLPLIFVNESGVNYPGNKSFGLDTYVGTFSVKSGEAINVLPSIIGTTLVGINKTNQNGMNWVLMGQDFFNNIPEEYVYLNNNNGRSGIDWWYDIMPNIYFYQLNDLYPGVGDADFQFTTIADQWLKAVKAMGGAGTPWEIPFMDYRAWSLSTMTPLTTGVREPEAAGGISWLLYNAYLKTGNVNYLTGAEWSLEFLNNLTANPSYELQLPYGTYIAAKMNAQIGTSYDIEKMLNWTFDRGDLRGWGAIVGNWNGVEASGLIGEANDQGDDYAFLMNGFQHAGALVPMVRYDKRFARAIGKWMLNLANATRLFYPGFLTDAQQDASNWSTAYDPEGYIGYEGLREKLNGTPGPFSTGDAAAAGWSNTNLALYGSSSVGIFGGIIKTTNEEKILQLDLLKTDYYREDAYPTYLYYNPYSSSRAVAIDVGLSPVDLYNVLSETFLAQGVSGITNFTIAGDGVVELVLVPAGGVVSYNLNKMLINDIVVDYMQSSQAYNYPPRIKSLVAGDELLVKGSSTTIYATAVDLEGGPLTYSWVINGVVQGETGATLLWTAPQAIGIYQISLTVTDEQLNETSSSISIEVVDYINSPPVIIDINADKINVNPLENVEVICLAEDIDGDTLNYSWSASAGTISGAGNTIVWQSPAAEGIYTVSVVVDDGNGGITESKVNFLVKDYAVIETGKLIAYYPFSGNANDISGNNLNGQVLGAVLTDDLQGGAAGAYYFDGVNDFIKVGNIDLLNFTDAITISCWIRPENLLSGKESFILSHGSWQNRWKISMVSGKVRWTLKTLATIKDVDSSFGLIDNESYHVTATYDRNYALLYIDGKLDSFEVLSGNINLSPTDFLIGKMLPDDKNAYNYRGLIDEILVYDYALSPEDVIRNMDGQIVTGVDPTVYDEIIEVYPNPTTGMVSVRLSINQRVDLLSVYNVYGRKLSIDYRKNENYKNAYILDFTSYPNGIYYLQFEGLKRNQTEKILVFK
jgi:concanavalin A-like lectin/glucanase superfamily protein/type IX secretion system substrate protein/Big-like domain-containing protein